MKYIKPFTDWLFEAEIKELTSEYQGSTQRRRISFSGWDRRRLTFNFKSFGTKEYDLKIRIDDYSKISRLKGSYREKLNLALDGNVKVFCSCPSFRYNGYKYMADQLDYGLRKENRFPGIRNPLLKGTVCKHLYQLMETIDNYEDVMTEAIRSTLEKEKQERKEKSNK